MGTLCYATIKQPDNAFITTQETDASWIYIQRKDRKKIESATGNSIMLIYA